MCDRALLDILKTDFDTWYLSATAILNFRVKVKLIMIETKLKTILSVNKRNYFTSKF